MNKMLCCIDRNGKLNQQKVMHTSVLSLKTQQIAKSRVPRLNDYMCTSDLNAHI